MTNQIPVSQPDPSRTGSWVDAYLPEQQMVAYQQPPAQFINFDFVRGLLFRQRWLIAGVIFLSLVGGLVITLLTPSVYEATAQVSVEPFNVSVLEDDSLQSNIPINAVDEYLKTLLAVIQSRSLAEVVVDNLNLADRTDLLGKEIDETRPPNLSDDAWRQSKRMKAVTLLTESVVAETPGNAWIISIGFRSRNPVLAAEIANSYTDAFAANKVRNSLQDNEYARGYLDEQIAVVRAELEAAEQAVNNYARDSAIIVQPDLSTEAGQVTLNSSNLSSINQRAAEARAARIVAEQRWRSIQSLPAAQLPEVQSNPVLQGLIAERTAKQTQLAELRQRYNDDFPQIANLQAQIRTIDSQIDRSSADIKATVRNAYVVAQNQEDALAAELASAKGVTIAEQTDKVELSVLERKAQALRDQLRALLDRFNQISSAANLDPRTITKLDSAVIPTAPVTPDLTKNLLLALVFGIAAAAGLSVLRETLDDRVRSLDDVEEKLGLSLLGYTPHVDASEIETHDSNRFSALMEAYSSIRASIDFAVPRTKNVIQFTSTQPAEGKSTTAVILAELFSKLGRKTLLIDADLRRPSVAGLLGMERPKVGFIEVLLGHAKLEDALVKGAHPNLEILPVGEIPPNPTEVIASREMQQFIEMVRNEYSLVIIDTPPVMGLADAPLMSNLVDGTVFVLEANKVPFGQARNALRRLKDSGNIIGLVLTKYRALEAGQYSGYQYGYYEYRSEDR